jgi:hypothetical protein
MTRRGPIQAELRERLDDRSGQTLALWERDSTPTSAGEPPWRHVDALAPAEWQKVLQGARSVVVACTSRHPPWMREAIAWSSQKARLRTYLLGPERWVSSPELQTLVKQGAPRLLTRLGAEPPADWIVADGERGWLVLGAPGEARRWVLGLDPGLARSLHETFVHLFWHQSRHESAPGGRFRDSLPAPFPGPSEAVRPLARGQLVLRPRQAEPLLADAECVVEPLAAPVQGTPHLLMSPPGRGDFPRLAGHVDQGTQVAWLDAALPRLALTRRRMVVELGEGPDRLRLEFEASDAIQMMNALETWAGPGAWRFHPARALRDVRGPVWLEGKAEAQPVQDELTVEQGEVPVADLFALDTGAPAKWQEPPALARRVRYRWKTLPPLLPKGAQSAKLVREWEQLDSHVENRARTVAESLERMEREEGERGLLARLTGLVQSWKNVGSRRKRLRLALDEVREQPLSKRPAEAARLVASLEAQEKELTELARFCQEQEEQEELRLAEEAQQAQHTHRVEEARRRREGLETEHGGLRTQSTEKRKALLGMEDAYQALTERAARAEHDARVEQARQQLAEGQARLDVETQRRQELQSVLETLAQNASKQERKRRKAELHEQEDALKRLQSGLDQYRLQADSPFRPGTLPVGTDPERNRVEAQLQSLRKEIAALENEEQRTQKEIDARAKEEAEPFVFRPPPRPARAGRKQAPTPGPVLIPKEPLPGRGVLWEHGGRRYLVVSTWEDAEGARADAVRLEAQLVTVERVT